MSWFASILIGILCAAIGGAVSGLVAGLCVEWYQISGFEGGSGYFIALLILLGIVVGLICGISVSRVVAASATPGALRAFGIAAGILLGTAGLSGGIARLLADVPPTLNGQELLLLVEVRWPASHTDSPATDTVARSIRLGSLAGGTLRKSERGPLWMRDARFDGGHWVVPGAVEIFTNRGTRVVSVEPEIPDAHGLLLPMNGSPGSKDLSWSDWMPRARPGAAPLPDGFTYRYKVIRRNEAVRTDTVGPFEIATIVTSFYDAGLVNRKSAIGARAEFVIHHHGQPLALGSAEPNITGVATLPGSPTALLVRDEQFNGSVAQCHLVVEQGDGLHASDGWSCTNALRAPLLTNDPAQWSVAQQVEPVPGEIDRTTFATGGLYLFENALFDADHRQVRNFSNINMPALHGSVGPLGVSPDQLSFVRLGYGDASDNPPALVVVDAEAHSTYHVGIELAATRYGGADAIGPEWLNHYYQWERSAGEHDRLTVRHGVVPLPFKGVVKIDAVDYAEYQVGPAGKAMAEALAEFLRTEFNAQHTSADASGSGFEMHIGNTVVHVFNNESAGHVAVFNDRGTDATIVSRIGERFNAVLATGKHDALFTYSTSPPGK